jgi:hypothetical protein
MLFRICHKEELKLTGTCYLLACAGDGNILGENMSIIKKKTEASV